MVAVKKLPSNGVKAKQGFVGKKSAAKPRQVTDGGAAITMDRRAQDRRQQDRRAGQVPVALEHRGGERRKKVNRRRQIDPTTCERDYTPDEVEFMSAMDNYKRRSGRMFPTCSEVLEVLKSLGYEKRPKTDAVTLPSPELTVTMPEGSLGQTFVPVATP